MSIKEIIDKLYTNEVVFMYDFALSLFWVTKSCEETKK